MKAKNDCFDLVGVSFHVGSGCYSAEAFKLAVEYAGRIADLAKSFGHPMSLLDIGGGYMTIGSMKHYMHDEQHPGFSNLSEAGQFNLKFEEIA